MYRLRFALVFYLIFVSMLLVFNSEEPRPPAEDRKYSKAERRKAKAEYFFQVLRDPVSNSIPRNTLGLEQQAFLKVTETQLQADLEWQEAGPSNVGGRTRALAVDLQDSNTLIAGAVSGGIWKSENKGSTWSLKNDSQQQLSVTALTQDPRPGQHNKWYYASGERLGSSADFGQKAIYYGGGLFKSEDNGDSWSLLRDSGSPTDHDSPFDFVSKLDVREESGSLFMASNFHPLLRSDDEGLSFESILGKEGEHSWTDFDIGTDGSIIAVLSTNRDLTPSTSPGVYHSTDNGDTWEDITPDVFPDNHIRSVISIAPSNPKIVYIFTSDGRTGFGGALFKIDLSNSTAFDLTENTPKLEEPFYSEGLYMQGGYNMVLEVKPDDENYVILGATNLYRSTDGFTTPVGYEDRHWIGGFGDGDSHCSDCYAGNHPDHHVVVFDPNDSSIIWNGHDGGISYSDNLLNEKLMWERKNDGYNVTQFYTVASSKEAGDVRIAGGTQDNGSPFFNFQTDPIPSEGDLTGADGGFLYMGEKSIVASWQFGTLFEIPYLSDGQPNLERRNFIGPEIEFGLKFIHPFAVDPNDENVIYYPSGRTLSRSEGPDREWRALQNVDTGIGGGNISAISISQSNPPHRLYFGSSRDEDTPKLFRLDSASSAIDGEVEISIPEAETGSYLHDIAINPIDGDEVIAVFSNYGVASLFHSTDAGNNWEAIEGNLDLENGMPSIRSATILPFGGQTHYLIATSIGVFYSTELDGSGTSWSPSGSDILGKVVVSQIRSRPSDGKVFAATHGRGLFIGDVSQIPVSSESNLSTPTNRKLIRTSYPNPAREHVSILVEVEKTEDILVEVFDMQGRRVMTESQLLLRGPRNIQLNTSDWNAGSYVVRIGTKTRDQPGFLDSAIIQIL